MTLPDRFVGKGNMKAQQSAMKLTELGPRLTLELFKVEQGVNEGDVLYHKFVHKTPAEAAAIKAKVRVAFSCHGFRRCAVILCQSSTVRSSLRVFTQTSPRYTFCLYIARWRRRRSSRRSAVRRRRRM